MPSKPAAVLIVGSINVDLVVRVERLPAAGETVTGGTLARHHGGKGANQAVAASRLGASVRFVGAVGADEDGRSALSDLRREGVAVDGISVLDGVSTGVALIVVDATGENQVAVASGANETLDASLVEQGLDRVAPARGGVYLANFEISDEALMAGARHAIRQGMRVVVNPAPARVLPPELLALRPVVLANVAEAEALTGERETEAAARSLAYQTTETVVVTLGAHGALLLEGSTVRHLPAPPVRAVDSTGAGDTFAGAFAAELASGASIADSARFGVAAATLSVTREGARGGMPRRAEVLALLD